LAKVKLRDRFEIRCQERSGDQEGVLFRGTDGKIPVGISRPIPGRLLRCWSLAALEFCSSPTTSTATYRPARQAPTTISRRKLSASSSDTVAGLDRNG
jgi:hypothetical protein